MRLRHATTLLLLGVCLALGQTNQGSMSGLVSDPGAGVIPGAKIVATKIETRQNFETISSEAGVYVFPNLPTGTYTVTVEKQGFKRATLSGVEIRIAQRQPLDFKLEVGEVQQTVEVTAEAPLLETTSSERGSGVSQKMLSTLPLFAGGIRGFEAFIGYMPGVNSGGETSISGSGGRGKEVLIDGGSTTIPESGGVIFNPPSIDQFGEFKLLTGNYSAEYGRFGGGVEIFVTRSGTNDLHGGAFLNLRRDIWNANSWANNRLGRARAKERYSEAGGVIGGPVWIPKVYDGRNKTFWFLTLDRDLRPAIALPNTGTVPTAAYKNGDFSASPQVVYDPASSNIAAERTPFPNGIIPKSRWSKVSSNIIPLIPDPTRASTTSNFDYVGAQTYEDPHWSLKFDHMITNNMRVSYYMSREQQNTGVSSVLPGPLGQGLGASLQRPENYRANHDWTITPTTVMHTTFSFTRQQQSWDNPAQQGYGSKIGLPLSGLADAFPRVQWLNSRDNLTPWGVQDGKVSNGTQFNWTWHWAQNLSIVKGKHEFKMGWELRRLRTFSDPVDLAGTNGLYQFNTLQTGLPGNTNTGNPFASFLLGLPDQASTTSLPVLAGQIQYRYYGGYFQDNWKLTSRLTLNLGMRYEVPIGWHVKNGDYSWVDLKTLNPATGTMGALVFAGKGTGRTGSIRPYDTDFSDVGPRLGFAYRLFDKTVIRGGYGMYYQTLSNGGCGCRDGFGGPPVTKQSDGVNGALQWDGGIPIPAGAAAPPFIDPTFDNGNAVESITPTFGKAPRMQEWSLNVQHEIKNFLIDVAYVGNRGTGLNSSVDLNQLPVSRLALGTLLTKKITDPAVVAAGFKKPYASFPDSSNLAQALRPYPQYLLIRGRNTGQGKIWYDALQLKAERRMGSLQLMGSYVWSKSLALAHYRQIFSQTQVQAQDYYNYDDMKSFSPFHQPHVVNILASYDLPVGRGKKFLNVQSRWLDSAIGGWNVALAARYYTPTGFQVAAPGNDLSSTIFSGYKKADRNMDQAIRTSLGRGDIETLLNAYLVGGATAANAQKYFNPAAFSPNATVTGQAPKLGNAATYYSEFRNPNVYTENIAVSKRFRFPITEQRTVDLVYRADAINAFNRTNFGGIVTTIGSANFGLPTGPQSGARLLTMGLRLDF